LEINLELANYVTAEGEERDSLAQFVPGVSSQRTFLK
jgi:hypothetical protein